MASAVRDPLFNCICCGLSVESLSLRINGERPNLSKRLCPYCNGLRKKVKHRPKPFTHVCDTCGDGCYGVRCQKCRTTRNCSACGVSFRSRTNRVYCSRECELAGRGVKSSRRTCTQCGGEFRPNGGKNTKRQRFCSVECRAAWRRATVPPKPGPRSRIYVKACDVCGSLFTARHAQTKRCSLQCRIDHSGIRIKGLLYGDIIDYDPITRRYPGKSRRDALIAYLVDRDGDKCGICRRKVDITLKSGTKGSRKGPSVDHIIPRSLGGSDDLSNLRLAHWGCNQKRGNRMRSEQLALVG